MTLYQRIVHTFSVFLVLIAVCVAATANEKNKKTKFPKWMKRSYLSLGWSAALPLWDTYKKTEGLSPAGAELSYQLRLHPRVTLGPDVHWQLFDAPSSDRHIDAGENAPAQVNTWLERRFLCAALTTHFYFLKRKTMMPYLGFGLGAMRVREKRGALSADDEKTIDWHLLTSPEIGMYLLHGRIPVWLAGRAFIGMPSPENDAEMLLVLTLGVTVPN